MKMYKEYFSSDGLIAYAVCRYCGEVFKNISGKYKDDAAKAESYSELMQHQERDCEKNPNRKRTESDEYMDELKRKIMGNEND